MANKTKLLSVAQAAIQLELTKWAIYKAIESGKLEAFKIDKTYVITPAAVDSYRESSSYKSPGRKSKELPK